MIKVLQIGEGNFLRAFVEHFIELSNEKGVFDGKVAICQPRKNTKVINALKEQNGEYNILLRGRLDGRVINDVKHIDCIEKCIDTVGEYDELKKTFCLDSLQIVVSNTTEAGICFDENDRFENSPNISFPGKITALLFERYKKSKSGLVFLPVELIENNGTELEKCIIKYAKLWNLESGFINFIENKCSFCNTLVDRIVTGKAEYKNDNCAVALEPLKQGEVADGIKILDDIPFGHKVLLEDKNENENIIKYGNAIGHLTKYCKKGEHIHEHNLKTNLSDIIDYSFGGDNKYEPKESNITFDGYLRENGTAA